MVVLVLSVKVVWLGVFSIRQSIAFVWFRSVWWQQLLVICYILVVLFVLFVIRSFLVMVFFIQGVLGRFQGVQQVRVSIQLRWFRNFRDICFLFIFQVRVVRLQELLKSWLLAIRILVVRGERLGLVYIVLFCRLLQDFFGWCFMCLMSLGDGKYKLFLRNERYEFEKIIGLGNLSFLN